MQIAVERRLKILLDDLQISFDAAADPCFIVRAGFIQILNEAAAGYAGGTAYEASLFNQGTPEPHFWMHPANIITAGLSPLTT